MMLNLQLLEIRSDTYIKLLEEFFLVDYIGICIFVSNSM